jgi:hypothetical protein
MPCAPIPHARRTETASEETLLLHELEKKRLLEQRADKAPILKLLRRYLTLLEEMLELEVPRTRLPRPSEHSPDFFHYPRLQQTIRIV